MMFQTPMKKIESGSYVRAQFGLRVMVDQAPYCSVTGDEYAQPIARDRHMISCGQICDRVAEAYPELVQIQRWHLCTDGIPMYYIANAQYWHEIANFVKKASQHGPNHEQARGIFASHALLGVLDTDPSGEALLELPWYRARVALEVREPMLRAAFKAQVVDLLPQIAEQLNAKEIPD